MCIVCFSDKPVEDGKYAQYNENPQQFQIGMCEWYKAPCSCFAGATCCCCTQMYIRKRALKGNMDNYLCCQGYFPGCCCLKPGKMGDTSCPSLCLCLEAWCCLSCALSTNRMLIMDTFQVHPDPWDNRIIRCNNALQALSCICDLLAICVPELRDVARILDIIAQLVFYSVAGCMSAQMIYQLEYEESQAPKGETMHR